MDNATLLRALLLDLGGVLIIPENSPKRQHWLDRLGREDQELAAWIWNTPMAEAAMRGELSPTGFWRAIGSALGLSAAESDAFVDDYWTGDRVNGAAVSLAKLAGAHGMRIGVLSNAYGDIHELLSKHGLLDLFHEVVNSSLEGLTKPDPAIYHLACSRLGVGPQETLFIDDRRDNADGARQAGLQALHYAGEDTIAEAARLLGLPWNR